MTPRELVMRLIRAKATKVNTGMGTYRFIRAPSTEMTSSTVRRTRRR